MARSPVRDLMSRAVGGDLDGTLLQLRADGLTYEQIAGRLYHEHSIEVTGQTIRNWVVAIDTTEAAS